MSPRRGRLSAAAASGGAEVQTARSSRSAARSGRGAADDISAAVAEVEFDQDHAGEHDRDAAVVPTARSSRSAASSGRGAAGDISARSPRSSSTRTTPTSTTTAAIGDGAVAQTARSSRSAASSGRGAPNISARSTKEQRRRARPRRRFG